MSQCHGCAQGFGFLKREFGCPNCGFSYCKKCLRFKIKEDPSSKSSKELLVCGRCFRIATSNMDPEEPPLITKALQRLESMENPSKPPITMYQQSQRELRLAQLKKGLSIEDQALAERLESLRKTHHHVHKNDDNSNPSSRRKSDQNSQGDIEARLARLKGEMPVVQSGSIGVSPLNKTKPETDEDLIVRYSEEVKLDKNYDTQVVSDIEGRLAKLRGDRQTDIQNPSSSGGSGGPPTRTEFVDEDISEEEQIQRILERFKAEVELESKMGASSSPDQQKDDSAEGTISTDKADEDIHMPSSDEDDDIDVDDLCRICDEKRATLKCEECDGDLFCKNCFHELHTEMGEIHSSTPYKIKR